MSHQQLQMNELTESIKFNLFLGQRVVEKEVVQQPHRKDSTCFWIRYVALIVDCWQFGFYYVIIYLWQLHETLSFSICFLLYEEGLI